MTVQPTWVEGIDIQDFTVRVVTNQNVHITSEDGTLGKTNKMLINDLGALEPLINNPFRDLDSENSTIVEQLANGTYTGEAQISVENGTSLMVNTSLVDVLNSTI